MNKSAIILKYEGMLAQTYGMQREALKERNEIKLMLEKATDDAVLMHTLNLRTRINIDNITSHTFLIELLEGFLGDLRVINSLN
jgi:hypothetical protein